MLYNRIKTMKTEANDERDRRQRDLWPQLASCMTLRELLALSVPQFHHFKMKILLVLIS